MSHPSKRTTRRNLAFLATAILVTASAACGQLKPPAGSVEQGSSAVRAASAGSVVGRIGYRDAAGLERLSGRGIDLFEDVDASTHTVGARLTMAQVGQLRAEGFTVSVSRVQSLRAGPPTGYRTVAQIEQTIQGLATKYPAQCQVSTLGRSREGRGILAIALKGRRPAGAKAAPEVLFYAGEHARELPPVEVQLRLATYLLAQYGQDPVVTDLLDTRDIWIVPLVNPDGRLRVDAGDPMWRKNTRDNGDGSFGVDLNRNYDNHWNLGNPSPVEEDYRGPSAESEPETVTLRNFLLAHDFVLSVDMHCFAGMVLWPRGYDKQFSPQEALLGRIGRAVASRLAYKAGSIARTLYTISGDSSTWALERKGTLAFTVELNDKGFSPPFAAVDQDWAEWRWPLMWMARVAGAPAEAELLLPADPTLPVGRRSSPR
jgi:hypothetical protein